MKKRVLIIASFLIVAFAVAVSLNSLRACIIIGLLFLLFCVTIGLKKSRLSRKWNKAPDLLNDDKRNYNSIELGFSVVDNSGLDMTQKYSNLYSDFLVLKRWYSLLDEGGVVKINVKDTRKYMFKLKPSVFSLCMLHPVTLLEEGQFYYYYENKWNELLNPLLYLISVPNTKRENIYNEQLINEINTFCVDRHIKIKWYVYGEEKKCRY